MNHSMPAPSVLHSLLGFAQNLLHWVSDVNHLIFCYPLSSHLQSFIESRSFPMVSSSHQVAKVLELQLQHQYSQWNSVLISFRIDWFDLLSVQWTLKSFLQCHSSKASTPQHSAIFMVQLSHPYMTIGKTITLTIWIFIGKVMSLFF